MYKDATVLFSTVIVLFVGSFIVVTFIAETLTEEPITSAPARNNQSSQILQVKPAQGDGPEPVDYPLQGSKKVQQEAQGGLQKPQTSDTLQPNAGLSDFPRE